jgi:hypothetical protein
VEIALTALATVFGGACAFALGQLILHGTINPALELKRLIGAVAFDLDFYGTNDLYKGKQLEEEWRSRLARHAISLREKLNLILWYPGFKILLQLPSATDVLEASRELTMEAYRSATIEGWTPSRADKVKKLLGIKF